MKYLVGAGAIIGGVVLIAASGTRLPGFEHERRTGDSPSKQFPPSSPNAPWSACQDSELGVLKQVAVAGRDVGLATVEADRQPAPIPSDELAESARGLFSSPAASADGEPIAYVIVGSVSSPQPSTQVHQLDHGQPGGEPVPSVPTLTHFALFGGGEVFSFTVEGPPGARYFLETSKDLHNWTSVEGATTGGANPPSGFVTKDEVGERFFVRIRLP